MAHLLTLIRLVLALPFAWLIERASQASALLLALAIASDLLDGPLARRRGTASARGRLFDHGADFAFVCAGLLAAAERGAVPGLLPVAVSAAFAQYVLDSRLAHGARVLRPNRLGRWNGVLYFAPLVGVCLMDLGLAGLAPAVHALGWLLVVTSALSSVERLLSLRVGRGAPAAPGAGTPGRWPH